MLLKCCTQHASKFGKLNRGHRTGKGSFHPNPKERQCKRIFKVSHNCTHLTHSQSNTQNFPSQAKQYINHELPDVLLDLEKAAEQEIKLPTLVESSKKQESSRNTSTSALLTIPKPLTLWITTNCGKF